MELPIIAITMGDAAGIGPEIIVKALENRDVYRKSIPLVIGDFSVMKNALRFRQQGNSLNIKQISDPSGVESSPGTIYLIQPGKTLRDIMPGKMSPEAGRGSYEFVCKAADLAKKGYIDGIVTAPLNKGALHLAGYNFPGHTELLAGEFGVKTFSLVLSARGKFVFHVTTHVSLKNAISMLDEKRVLGQIRLAGALSKALERSDETIAVAGLNPHAGEGGLFGSEEETAIKPAIARAIEEGFKVEGPVPADVLFPRMVRDVYSFVIAMYHDQGHSVFKSVYFDEGINVTVGLPTIRTSVDHGTAFDIAGKGIAKEESLLAALSLAAELGPKWSQISAAVNSIGNFRYIADCDA
jgi:4-hydroxythreonine-4-phosphate dehydrogenase